MARSLNRAQLISNLTRDPELRYTPNGSAVCTFGLATNRTWTTDSGEKREEADFHNIVAWNKLAELCSQFLAKGRKVFVEGRLSTRSWTSQDGQQKSKTEIIIDDMIILDSKGGSSANLGGGHQASSGYNDVQDTGVKENKVESEKVNSEEEVSPDDIPF
jgi:single-strand DNA-binding protein